MRVRVSIVSIVWIVSALTLTLTPPTGAQGQEAAADEEVVITGSRIRRDPLNEITAVMDIGTEQLDATGLTNLGDALQNLPITGSAPNSQFNVPGNSGFPQDGSGIGAGAVQLSLRNLGAQRTLILVDGKRWVAGASASGVPGTVDLNTLPANVISRIEILQDGASAIYGSDAIGGVVNVITNSDFEGFRFDVQTGSYLSESDGESSEIAALWGGGNDTTHIVFSASYSDEDGIETADRAVSAFPTPFGTSCADGGCSSFTPQARLLLGPGLDGANITLNDGVLNDGAGNIPFFDAANPITEANPTAGDFHLFTSADRFNFNGPGFNFIKTPNERVNLYTSLRHQLSDALNLIVRASYTNRSSETKAAPEPLCLGADCGNRINDNFVVSALNPFNPFGVDLSLANGNMVFLGRRPLESGRRLFFQDINTYFVSAGLEGEFDAADRTFYWDVTGSYGDNRGFQEKFNSHNAAKLQVAMGDPAVCAATPNCVPFNFFGGQGPNGTGSITQEMLDFVTYTQRDFSEQTLKDFAFNITGDVMSLPAGDLAFAAGLEFRDHEGSYRPDPIAERGETAGIPAGSTTGGFDVTEFYGELRIPVLQGRRGAESLEVNLAARSSDYNTSGSEGTYKGGVLWQPTSDLSLRGSFSTGFRAPGIGELFGGAAREDFTFLDPCADLLGTIFVADGGRLDPDMGPNPNPQPQNIIDNCATLGIAPGFAQTNPQLSSVSRGNTALQAETSDSFMAGFVYSPEWARNLTWTDGLTVSVDFYDVEVDDAVQGIGAGALINACVQTLDPFFCNFVPRTAANTIGLVDNQLQNIGSIEASGLDILLQYASPEFRIGQFNLNFNATKLSDYTERTRNPDGTQTATDRTGTHTDETFARAFPDLRATANIEWLKDRWSGSLSYRWVDSMRLDSDTKLASAGFMDVQLRYNPAFGDGAFDFAVGLNNVFDKHPPACNECGGPGISIVVHDIPDTVGYIRATYRK